MLDGLADVPDQLFNRAALARAAVALEGDRGRLDRTRLVLRPDRSHRGAVVNRLADAPGPALFLHFVLHVAALHFEAHGIAVDVIHLVLAPVGHSAFPARAPPPPLLV